MSMIEGEISLMSIKKWTRNVYRVLSEEGHFTKNGNKREKQGRIVVSLPMTVNSVIYFVCASKSRKWTERIYCEPGRKLYIGNFILIETVH